MEMLWVDGGVFTKVLEGGSMCASNGPGGGW